MKVCKKVRIHWGLCLTGLLAPVQSSTFGAGIAMGAEMGAARYVMLGTKRIQFDSGMTPQQFELLKSDLVRISALEFPKADPELLRVMGIQQARPADLTYWLAARVGYLVSDKFDLIQNAIVLKTQVQYPEVAETFDAFNAAKRSLAEFGASGGSSGGGAGSNAASASAPILMSNIGVETYFKGKEKSVLTGIRIPGIGMVPMTSPRVGVIQLGEGFLRDHEDMVPGLKRDSYAGFGFRASTLFHEARHSDGHGKSLSFFHVPCPVGHVYEGQLMCDNHLNGSNAVDGHFTLALAQSCGSQCTAKDREALKLVALDSLDRVVKAFPGPGPRDEKKRRGEAATLLANCEMFKQAGSGTPPRECSADHLRLQGQRVTEYDRKYAPVLSKDGDPAPERVSQ